MTFSALGKSHIVVQQGRSPNLGLFSLTYFSCFCGWQASHCEFTETDSFPSTGGINSIETSSLMRDIGGFLWQSDSETSCMNNFDLQINSARYSIGRQSGKTEDAYFFPNI